jgi:hypothetical protein
VLGELAEEGRVKAVRHSRRGRRAFGGANSGVLWCGISRDRRFLALLISDWDKFGVCESLNCKQFLSSWQNLRSVECSVLRD